MGQTDKWRTSLRRIGASLLALTRSRFELFGLELQEEKLRLLNTLAWFAVAITLGVAGLLLAFGALAIWLWNTAGYWGLIGLSAIALAAAGGVFWAARRRIRQQPPPFSETVAEFRKDGECLKKE